MVESSPLKKFTFLAIPSFSMSKIKLTSSIIKIISFLSGHKKHPAQTVLTARGCQTERSGSIPLLWRRGIQNNLEKGQTAPLC
jgi:hypothetical protein